MLSPAPAQERAQCKISATICEAALVCHHCKPLLIFWQALSLILQLYTDIIIKILFILAIALCKTMIVSPKLYQTFIKFSGKNITPLSKQYFKPHWFLNSLCSKLPCTTIFYDDVFLMRWKRSIHILTFLFPLVSNEDNKYSHLFINLLPVTAHLIPYLFYLSFHIANMHLLLKVHANGMKTCLFCCKTLVKSIYVYVSKSSCKCIIKN